MPPRRKKVQDENGACPVKKSRLHTESQCATVLKEDDKKALQPAAEITDSPCQSPAKKLRKQLNVKSPGPDVFQVKAREHKAPKNIKSKYFISEVQIAAPTEQKSAVKGCRRRKSAQCRADEASTPRDSLQQETASQVTRAKRSKSQTLTTKKSITEVADKSKIRKENNEKDMSMQNKQPKQKQQKCASRLNVSGKSGGQQATSKCQRNSPVKGKIPNIKLDHDVNIECHEGERDEDGRGRENEKVKDESSNSDSESDWEEVEELPDAEELWRSRIPDKPIEITLDKTELMSARQKKGSFDVKEYFRRQLNRFRTQTQENAHKVHLLCLLSHGRFKNGICCNVLLRSLALSLVPSEFTNKSCDRWTLQILTQFICWFKKTVSLKNNEQGVEVSKELSEKLASNFSERQSCSEHEFILMFTITCRSVGLSTRLVYSLQPITFKPADLKKNKAAKSSVTSVTNKKNESETLNSCKNKKRSKLAGARNICRSSSATMSESVSTADEDNQSDTSRVSTMPEAHGSQSQEDILDTKKQPTRHCRSKMNYDEGKKKKVPTATLR